jgi:hypothetical protein
MNSERLYEIIKEHGGVKAMLNTLVEYCILHQELEYLDVLTDVLNSKRYGNLSYREEKPEKLNIYED